MISRELTQSLKYHNIFFSGSCIRFSMGFEFFSTNFNVNFYAVCSVASGAIFVIDVDPKNSQLVVSGGEDDLAYLWDIETTEILLKCEGKFSRIAIGCNSLFESR